MNVFFESARERLPVSHIHYGAKMPERVEHDDNNAAAAVRSRARAKAHRLFGRTLSRDHCGQVDFSRGKVLGQIRRYAAVRRNIA
jgi:hypothetical protein